jgi:hypothetical protein
MIFYSIADHHSLWFRSLAEFGWRLQPARADLREGA